MICMHNVRECVAGRQADVFGGGGWLGGCGAVVTVEGPPESALDVPLIVFWSTF